jgi:hypothetical protein
MSAAEALKAAHAAGVIIAVDGDDLRLEAPTRPPAEVIDLLKRHKLEILEHIRPRKDGWSIIDWRGAFETRANIDAAHAFAWCMTTWLNRNPANSPPDRCLVCRKSNCENDPLLPYGIEAIGVAWLHSRCWPEWSSIRETEAAAALTEMRIVAPVRDIN